MRKRRTEKQERAAMRNFGKFSLTGMKSRLSIMLDREELTSREVYKIRALISIFNRILEAWDRSTKRIMRGDKDISG